MREIFILFAGIYTVYHTAAFLCGALLSKLFLFNKFGVLRLVFSPRGTINSAKKRVGGTIRHLICALIGAGTLIMKTHPEIIQTLRMM